MVIYKICYVQDLYEIIWKCWGKNGCIKDKIIFHVNSDYLFI